MDYLLTFEDGSEGYLAHHGVKGMKWGVWNAETASRYSGGSGHRAIARANKKVNKAFGQYENAVKTTGESSYKTRAAAKKLGDAIEKREFNVERFHPGEGDISTSRYNELRSNQRVKRAALTGAFAGGPWGAAMGYMVSTASATMGRRAVSDVLKGTETYRVDKHTGNYENTTPFNTESNRAANTNPIYTKQSSKKTEIPKWKQAGYSSEAEHRAAINEVVKELEKRGDGKVISTYYDDKPKRR